MPHRPPSAAPNPNWLLGSRAIAVLSCALALLAANPAMGSTRPTETAGLVRTFSPATASVFAVEAQLQERTARPKRASRAARPTEAATATRAGREQHMFEALAQWSDLLTKELASLLAVTPEMAFAEGRFGIPSHNGHSSPARADALALPAAYESVFAIYHHLLAPPSLLA